MVDCAVIIVGSIHQINEFFVQFLITVHKARDARLYSIALGLRKALDASLEHGFIAVSAAA